MRWLSRASAGSNRKRRKRECNERSANMGSFIEASPYRKEPRWNKRRRSSITAYWKSRFRFRNSKATDALFLLKERASLQSHPKVRLHNHGPHRTRSKRGEVYLTVV